MTDREELIDYGQRQLQRKREQRMADITEGDIEVDPDLLDVGDEVAEETVSAFRRAKTWLGDGLKLEDRSRGGVQSKFSEAEQRAAVTRATDMMLAQEIVPTKAYAAVGAEIGVDGSTIKTWAHKYGLVPDPQDARSMGRERKHTWDLMRRQALFDDALDIGDLLITRMKVWIQNPALAPEDWNAENAYNRLMIPLAVAHDKLTHIEDVMVARGIRDVDSEDLQRELEAGEERLRLMEGN